MTKKIFEVGYGGNLSILGRDGYASHGVVGQPSDFYVYVRSDTSPWSRWIKGRPELHAALKRLHTGREREAFIAQIKQLMKEHPRGAR